MHGIHVVYLPYEFAFVASTNGAEKCGVEFSTSRTFSLLALLDTMEQQKRA